jgi:hypothetical protein
MPKPSISGRPVDGAHQEEADDDASLVDLAPIMRDSPPWLVSAIVHMAGMIILGLVLAHSHETPDLLLEAGYADDVGPELDELDLTGQEIDIEEPTFVSENLPIVSDPFSMPNITNLAPLPAMGSGMPAPTLSGGLLAGRQPGMKEALLKRGGGTAKTEGAVALGLRWLANNQQRNGLWSLRGPYSDGSHSENVEAATAMALLAFQGAGHTPDGDPQHQYTRVVRHGWNSLLDKLDESGKFFHGISDQHQLYTQAQCTIALCELYAMTRDQKYFEPAQRAVDYCVRIQSALGGWRYVPGSDADLSVTGWMVMALQSARMAGIEVPSPVWEKISQFLDSVSADEGARYKYQMRGGATVAMTAEGLLCRQFLGWKQDDPRLVAGVDYILANPPGSSPVENVYYWYYATQVCHHMEGTKWEQWNEIMREYLPDKQVKTGRERGSWDPNNDRWGTPNYGGRLFVTCLSIYTLEVYYRHLPLYQTGLIGAP